MNPDQMFDIACSFRLCCGTHDDMEGGIVEAAALEAAYRVFYQESGSDERAIEVGMSKLLMLGNVDRFTKRTRHLYRAAFLSMTVMARAGLTHAGRVR